MYLISYSDLKQDQKQPPLFGCSTGSNVVKDHISIFMLTPYHWLIVNVGPTKTSVFLLHQLQPSSHPLCWQLLFYFIFDSKVGLHISLYPAAVLTFHQLET